MTDYFALLNQPRSPWLEPEQLKEAFHARTREAHPDAQQAESDVAFVQVNEAYQVLRDPKRRLQHLLALLGQAPAGRSAVIPPEVEQLFPVVADLTTAADTLLQKLSASTNALSLSLLRPEQLRTRGAIEETLERLRQLQTKAEDELRDVDAEAVDALQDLYLRFSYLSRWIAELEEKKLRLTL